MTASLDSFISQSFSASFLAPSHWRHSSRLPHTCSVVDQDGFASLTFHTSVRNPEPPLASYLFSASECAHSLAGDHSSHSFPGFSHWCSNQTLIPYSLKGHSLYAFQTFYVFLRARIRDVVCLSLEHTFLFYLSCQPIVYLFTRFSSHLPHLVFFYWFGVPKNKILHLFIVNCCASPFIALWLLFWSSSFIPDPSQFNAAQDSD